MTNIFISYNQRVQSEQSLALRLQTLGALYGMSVSLPDRIGLSGLKDTTRQRIDKADLFIVFATRRPSREVIDEINYANALKKKVIVVYDKDVRNNLKIKGVHEIEYDQKNDGPQKIITEINSIISKSKDDNALEAFLIVGLGLLLLAALTSKKK